MSAPCESHDPRAHVPARPSVLLVDDTPSNLMALEAVLKPIDANLVSVGSGKEAIDRVIDQPFAVVLLDVQMPGMDGFETAARIRETPHGREMPVLFVTAIQRDDFYVKRGYAAGAADYVTKPFDVDILRARVKAFVDLFQQREQVRAAEVALRTRERDEAIRKLVAFERIATAALEISDLPSFLRRLLDIVMEAVEAADIAAILLRHEDVLRATALVGAVDGGLDLSFVQRVGQGLAGTVAETRQPIHVPDRFLETEGEGAPLSRHEIRQMQETWGTRGLLGVPMLSDGELLGVAVVGSRRASMFSPADQRLVHAMAERAALTVARQQQQSRLRDVLMAAPALIARLRGPSFEYEFANPAYRAAFADGRDVAGRSFADVGVRLELLPLVEEAYRTAEQVSVSELRTTSDGSRAARTFGASIQPQRGASGDVEGVLVYLVDVTLHVEARQALERNQRERAELLERERLARADAEMASSAKDEFLATVSHELRTPLNAILGWARAAKADAPPKLDRALGIIERNARAQARIIEDVLDISRIISGKLRLDMGNVQLEQPIRAALEAVRPAADAKQLAIVVDMEEPGELLADPDRLQQIVWNLLSNAIKFTPKGGKVSLKAFREDGDVVISVSDSGDGMEQSFLPHVFDAFRQADGSTTRKNGGLGLGLAIVKQLVQAHGGIIQAESEGLGLGATFTLRLPVREVQSLRPDLRAYDGAVSTGTPETRLDGLRVLVVDDDEDARMLLAETLETLGATVSAAGSAREALESLPGACPHVLVSDISMPLVDGYTLLQRVRALRPEQGGRTPAIALTAHARREDAARALKAGFQIHLPKPVDLDRLILAIANLGSVSNVEGVAG
jgi:signal transduction histidine kinase/DNA-binding response OmpR family regulator